MKDPFDYGLWFLAGIAKRKEEVHFITSQFTNMCKSLHEGSLSTANIISFSIS